MALEKREPTLTQNSPLSLDCLFCEEEHFDDESDQEYDAEEGSETLDNDTVKKPLDLLFPQVLFEEGLVWEEDDELIALINKEKETYISISYLSLSSDGSLEMARKEAVEWMMRVNAHYGFSALTIVLAVNYFDRFTSILTFQRDKPWTTQLAAVACLSLAAKMEETQVPLLLDLQVEESKYVFEAKTIQRMELLVLSSLQWKMNPVTPLSFIDHVVRRLGLKTSFHWKLFSRCERLLISVIADIRSLCYLPSAISAATLLYVIEELETTNSSDYWLQLMDLMKIRKGELDKCYELILEVSGGNIWTRNQIHKRKLLASMPGSPNGVIDTSFSSDSSNNSWAVSSLPDPPPPKKSRAHEQKMRLQPFNRVSVGVLSRPQ